MVTLRAGFFQMSHKHAFAGANHVSQIRVGPKREMPAEGSVLAELTIPRLQFSSIVIEGDSAHDLRVAPGHIPGTALPGDSGNVGIAGHRDTVFRPLRMIRGSDVITLTTSRGAARYRVVSTKIVSPHDVGVLYPTSVDTLTLVTCYPFDFVGAAPNRFIVQARRVTGE